MKRVLFFLLLLLSSSNLAKSQDLLNVLTNGKTGIGTNMPSSQLEIVSPINDTELRISSTCGFCSTRLSFISDKGFSSEWRPGFIKSGDNSNFGGRLDFYTNGIGSGNAFGEVHGMSVYNGRVGIKETNPDATLEVNGYTMLGSDAPKIKMKKLLSTTSSTQGTAASILHGIGNADKILAIDIAVEHTADGYVHENYTFAGGYEFEVSYNNTEIIVWNTSSNSGNILSKPIKILVTYEE